MNNFKIYAKYYNLLYNDKDYLSEVEYIDGLIKKNSINFHGKILDLGCGTGKHANLFTQKGYNVHGVDISPQMVSEAKERYFENRKLKFYEGNITNFKNEHKYDVVTSLFHVMSYQNSNADFMGALKTAREHLNEEGLFIFDFWNGAGVLSDAPERRVKKLENGEISIERVAIPNLHVNENVVDVNYTINVYDKINKLNSVIKEKHSMRYFFKKELDFYLDVGGFKLNSFFEWMSFKTPDKNCWNAVIVAKKIKK
jgi:SAM-dependent methyltransferase